MPKYLSRRTMLRGMAGGTAVAVGLPTLDAMLNLTQSAHADGTDLPCRFMTYYWADGINIGRWEPAATGANWDLSEHLMPLANVKDYCSIISGMRNLCAEQITHHEGMTAFNGYTYESSGQLSTDAGGPTIDQVIADALNDATSTRAVHVQVSKRISTDGDGGTTVVGLSHRGVEGNVTAQTPEVNPIQVWQTLFGEFVPKPDDSALRLSILDHVRGHPQVRDALHRCANADGLAQGHSGPIADTHSFHSPLHDEEAELLVWLVIEELAFPLR